MGSDKRQMQRAMQLGGEAAGGDALFNETVFGPGVGKYLGGMLGGDDKERGARDASLGSVRHPASMYRALGASGGGVGGDRGGDRGGERAALRERYASNRGWRPDVGLPYLAGQNPPPHHRGAGRYAPTRAQYGNPRQKLHERFG